MTLDEIALSTMNAQWAGVYAQSASIVVTVVTIGTVARQIYDARKGADATLLFGIVREQSGLVRALLDAANDEEKRQRFHDVANFLEAMAASVNNGLFHRTSREFAADTLCSYLTDIQDEPEWSAQLNAGFDAPTTFKHLVKFMETHRRQLADVRAARKALAK